MLESVINDFLDKWFVKLWILTMMMLVGIPTVFGFAAALKYLFSVLSTGQCST
jgi:hypothetical protein